MIIRKIKPRQIKKGLKLVWVVVIPKDLRGDGGNRRFFGADKSAAEAFAKQLAKSRSSPSVNPELMKLKPAEQSAVLGALRELGVDDLLRAVAAWRTRQKTQIKSVPDAVAECVESKRLSGCRENYLATLECTLNNFARSVEKSLHEITPQHIAEWLNGNGWRPKTRLGYLKDVCTLFKFAIKRDWLAKNPCDGVDRPRLDHQPPKIFSVEECKRLLKAILETDRSLIGYIAPILFGGLRPAESSRLAAANVRGESIDLSGSQAKLRKRRVVKIDGLLGVWLSIPLATPHHGPAVRFGAVNLAKRLRKLATAAKITWSHDVLRHTFCSYALPKFGARATAELAGHSEQVLFAHYREIVSPENAEAFWNLTPRKY